MASSISQQHPGPGQTPAAKQPVEDLATPPADCWLLCLGPPPPATSPRLASTAAQEIQAVLLLTLSTRMHSPLSHIFRSSAPGSGPRLVQSISRAWVTCSVSGSHAGALGVRRLGEYLVPLVSVWEGDLCLVGSSPNTGKGFGWGSKRTIVHHGAFGHHPSVEVSTTVAA